MCLSPITIKCDPRHFQTSLHKDCNYIAVPCGRCYECLKRKQNDWFVRLFTEFQGQSVLFFTLTYRNDSVPFNVDTDTGEMFLSVCQEHLQLAMKRFRRNNPDLKFKYFITSEYGPKTNRPHYHGIINLSRLQFQPFLDDWNNRFGFTSCSKVNSLEASLKYCTKYALKGGFDNVLVSQGLVRKSFRLISKGIGKEWIKTHLYEYLNKGFIKKKLNGLWNKSYLDSIIDRFKLNINGFNYSLPKYFKEKIFSTSIEVEIVGKRKKVSLPSSLSFAIKKRIQERTQEVYLRKLEQLQAAIGERAAIQEMAYAELQEFYEKRNASLQGSIRYLQFLDKSYF